VRAGGGGGELPREMGQGIRGRGSLNFNDLLIRRPGSHRSVYS